MTGWLDDWMAGWREGWIDGWLDGGMAGWRDGGRLTLPVAGALPEAVPGMVVGLPRTLASLPATLSLRHSSVGAAAALVLSVVAAAVATEDRGRAARGRLGSGWARRRGELHHTPTG